MGLVLYSEIGLGQELLRPATRRKKSHHAAIRALAFKWIRILFRCWKDGVPYDDDATRYAAALQKHSPAKPEEIHWKNVAGFAKLAPFSS